MTTATTSTLIEPLRNAATLLLMVVFFGICLSAWIGIVGLALTVLDAVARAVFS